MRKVETGAIEKAKRYANELLEISSRNKDYWDYGNAIHDGNLILGRVALREGNTEAAKEYLLSAGQTPGSPNLDSFGPNMTLAKELLEAGEEETVLEYFELCDNFWELGSQYLRYWTAIVRSGQIPKFGVHLLY